jgi:hypothetical protein
MQTVELLTVEYLPVVPGVGVSDTTDEENTMNIHGLNSF